MEPEEIPAFDAKVRVISAKIADLLRDTDATPLEGCTATATMIGVSVALQGANDDKEMLKMLVSQMCNTHTQTIQKMAEIVEMVADAVGTA